MPTTWLPYYPLIGVLCAMWVLSFGVNRRANPAATVLVVSATVLLWPLLAPLAMELLVVRVRSFQARRRLRRLIAAERERIRTVELAVDALPVPVVSGDETVRMRKVGAS